MTLERLCGLDMAYFAEIDEANIVRRIISINNADAPDPAPDNSEALGQAFIRDILSLPGTWVQTSFNSSFRGKYAGIGDTWDGTNFVAPILEES